MSTGAILVFCSVPDMETGRKLADLLLNEKAAACVSIMPGVESHYNWQGKRERSTELLLLIKATAEQYKRIEGLIVSGHPYECPEIVAVPVTEGSPSYLAWLGVAAGKCGK